MDAIFSWMQFISIYMLIFSWNIYLKMLIVLQFNMFIIIIYI